MLYCGSAGLDATALLAWMRHSADGIRSAGLTFTENRRTVSKRLRDSGPQTNNIFRDMALSGVPPLRAASSRRTRYPALSFSFAPRPDDCCECRQVTSLTRATNLGSWLSWAGWIRTSSKVSPALKMTRCSVAWRSSSTNRALNCDDRRLGLTASACNLNTAVEQLALNCHLREHGKGIDFITPDPATSL